MRYLVKILSQPSSYAGLAGLALALGLSQPAYDHFSQAAAAVFGLVAFLLSDPKADA